MRRSAVLLLAGLLCVMAPQTVRATEEAQASTWVITTYTWDGGWVEHASWETSNHGDAVKIAIDAWNWSPEYPALTVQYDNVRAFGDVDLATGPDGLLDDFEDGIIAPFWSIGSSPGASVTETGGVLRVDIPAGPSGPAPAANHVAGAETGFILHGEFDVQVDFAVDPGFHQSGAFAANAKLFLEDEAGNALEASIRSGFYVSLELPAGGSGPIFQHITPTGDQAGRFRIVKAPADWTLNGFYQPVEMDGVYQPVEMDGVWNVIKGGQTVPLKFEVFAGDVELTDTAVVKSFTTSKVACPDGDAVVEEELEVTTTGGTSLRYDATGGQFIQNWQTPKASGVCYRATMTTQDGSTLIAFFRTK